MTGIESTVQRRNASSCAARHWQWLCLLLVAGIAGAEQPDMLEHELATIVRLLPGRYVGQADDPAQSGRQQPIRHKIARIRAPQLGELVFYYQLGSAAFEGQALQQKLFVFDTDPDRSSNRMQPLVILDGAPLIDLERHPHRWAELDPAAMMQFPPACALAWSADGDGFVARAERTQCEFSSAAFGQRIRPDMHYRLSASGFDWSETLYGEDGEAVVSTNGVINARRSD